MALRAEQSLGSIILTNAVELPADLLAERRDLLDDLFILAFDVLGLRKLDLRIRPYAAGDTTPASRLATSRSS